MMWVIEQPSRAPHQPYASSMLHFYLEVYDLTHITTALEKS